MLIRFHSIHKKIHMRPEWHKKKSYVPFLISAKTEHNDPVQNKKSKNFLYLPYKCWTERIVWRTFEESIGLKNSTNPNTSTRHRRSTWHGLSNNIGQPHELTRSKVQRYEKYKWIIHIPSIDAQIFIWIFSVQQKNTFNSIILLTFFFFFFFGPFFRCCSKFNRFPSTEKCQRKTISEQQNQ